MAETPMTDRDIQYKFREMSRQISNLKRKAGIARDKQIIAEARSHEQKMRAKSAEHGLRGLLQRCERNEHALARRDALLRETSDMIIEPNRNHQDAIRLLDRIQAELGDSHE
jgi:hypothetical protein